MIGLGSDKNIANGTDKKEEEKNEKCKEYENITKTIWNRESKKQMIWKFLQMLRQKCIAAAVLWIILFMKSLLYSGHGIYCDSKKTKKK